MDVSLVKVYQLMFYSDGPVLSASNVFLVVTFRSSLRSLNWQLQALKLADWISMERWVNVKLKMCSLFRGRSCKRLPILNVDQ